MNRYTPFCEIIVLYRCNKRPSITGGPPVIVMKAVYVCLGWCNVRSGGSDYLSTLESERYVLEDASVVDGSRC